MCFVFFLPEEPAPGCGLPRHRYCPVIAGTHRKAGPTEVGEEGITAAS